MNNNVEDSPVAIVLGGTAPHIALIDNLQQRGYYVILIDYFFCPPAKEFANEHVRESTLDRDAVYKVAKERCASVIVSTCLDQPLPVIAEVSKRLGLPYYLNERTALIVTNKQEMKQIFNKNKIPTAQWRIISRHNIEEVYSLRFPVVVKQISGTGSLGLVIVQKKQDLANLLEEPFDKASNMEVLVEEYYKGRELSADVIVVNGKSHVLLIRERHRTFLNNGQEVVCHGSVAPIDIPLTVKMSIRRLAQQVAIAFSLKNSPVMIQAILTECNTLCVLEIAARLGGGMSNILVCQRKQFDLLDATVSCSLNEEIQVNINENNDYYASVFVFASHGVLDRYSGFENLVEEGFAEKVNFIRVAGDQFPEHFSVKNRSVEMVVKASGKEALKRKIGMIFDRIDILDTDNTSLMIREIGLHLTL